MKNNIFTKSKLAASISLLMSASLAIPVVAQENTENDDFEVIQVTSGIRGSLIKSMDIKRDADGVVDAISAEELGKFPDTNLAESLQRITGVAVSRANGEGSQITVRGFGPQFNLVTLNGRQMASTGFTRSFNFENLSSVGVSALELYKSARADLPTGGLGATVNIVTARPLNSPGKKFTIMAKGINDTSNEVGDDLTPELAAVFSNTFGEDDRFGFSANISHSLRDFRRQGANIQGWKANAVTDVTDADGSIRMVELVNGASIPDTLDNIVDRRATDANGNLIKNYRGIDPETGNIIPTAAYFLPQDLNYSVQDISTKRTNAMATFQFAATDDLVFTLDHVISKATLGLDGYGWGIWNGGFGGNANAVEFDELGTAVFYNSSGDDVSFTRNRDTTKVDSKATSLNIEYDATDVLSFSIDFHNSISEISNGQDAGLGHSALMILGSPAFTDKSFDARGGDIPVFTANWNNGGSEVLPSEIGANLGIFTRSPGESEVSQFDFKGEWLLENNFGLTAITFGLGYIEQSLKSSNAVSQPAGYRFNTAVFPDGMFERIDTSLNLLDEFSFAGGMPPAYTYTYSIDEAIARSIAFFNSDNPVGNDFIIDNYLQSSSSSITEETTSAFLMSSWEFEVGEYYIDMRLGFRYEETDVVSPGQAQLPTGVVWNGGSEWRTQFADATTVNFSGNYDLFLPMMDLKVDITEDVVGRFSYGKSITRANLGDMLGALSVTGFPVPLARTGSRGNPSLLPFESTNLDFSLEYYYDEGSYASVGLFWKDVDNWIEPSRTTITFDGVENGNTAVHDIYLGQRWNEAEAALIANGEQATFDNIYNTIIANGVGVDGTTVLADPATDPLVEWLVSSPENVGARETNGIEFAIQHLFGETGFGVGFNATIVEGDVEYDRYLLATQAVLDGLGDSANFQVFYEKDGLSVKLTSAWRDEYLIGQGQGQGSSEAPPQFAEEYTQWDLSVNYDIDENVTVFFEGINLTNETERINGRFNTQFLSAAQYGPRYIVGIRYTMD